MSVPESFAGLPLVDPGPHPNGGPETTVRMTSGGEPWESPEGITVNPKTGDIIIGTYDARMPEPMRTNQLLRYSNDGKLVARRSFGATPLTGLAFFDGNIYVLNFGASKLQRIAATFDASTPIEDIAVFHPLTPPAPTASASGAATGAAPCGSISTTRPARCCAPA